MNFVKFLGSIIALIGVVCIFDGRRIIKKYFKDGDENLATSGIKILGFIISIIGALMIIDW